MRTLNKQFKIRKKIRDSEKYGEEGREDWVGKTQMGPVKVLH